jgi:CBS domain-containing protein
LPTILAEALGTSQTTFPLVATDGRLAGVIRVQDLHRALDDRGVLESVLVAADLATASRAVRVDDNVEQALEHLTEIGSDLLPVVDSEDRILGVIFAADVLDHYSRELQKLRLASTLARRRSFSIQTEGMELGHGMRLAEVQVPRALQDRTLKDAGLRARFGVEVLYVLKGPHGIRKLAHPDLMLEAGDGMVIMAEASSLQRFQEETKARVPPSSFQGGDGHG